MTMKKREPGFYWVKWADSGIWCVAELSYDDWFIAGNERELSETKFSEIDERRITRDRQERLVSLIKQARQEWLDHNDPKDGTDVVTPYDEVLYR